jgi:hypothetical protein
MNFTCLYPRALKRAAIVATSILALTVGTAVPSQAAVGDLTCTALFQMNFRPALKGATTASNSSIEVGLSNCLSLNGRYSDLSSGLMTGSGPATSLPGIPCSLVLTVNYKLKVDWSNGQTSKVDAEVNSNPLDGTIGFKGVVTGGPLTGDKIYAAGPVVPNADCLLRGLTSLVGVNQKLFY